MRTLTPPLTHAGQARRGRDDYAPSRLGYRATRLWLSPLVRLCLLWVLPLAVVGGGAALWLQQPKAQTQLQLWQARLSAELRAKEDFQVKHMAIRGASPELAREIRARIGVDFPLSVLDLPLDDVRATVAALDAVAEVEAHVQLGGALVLNVTERTPAVVWRNGGGLALLDATGNRVAVTDRRDGAPDLPLIAARGANRAVPEALEIVAAAAPLETRLRGLVRQGERRWDLVLTGGLVVQLPERDPVRQLERVIAMHDAGDLLNRDVRVVDMRNPARPTIRLGPQASGYLRTLRAFEAGRMNGG